MTSRRVTHPPLFLADSVVVDTVAGELDRVNHTEDITPDFEFRPNQKVFAMGPFHSAFLQLSNILSRRQAPSYTPQTQSPITTPPTQIVTPLDPPNTVAFPSDTEPALLNPMNLALKRPQIPLRWTFWRQRFCPLEPSCTTSVGIASVDTRSSQSNPLVCFSIGHAPPMSFVFI